MGFLVADVGDWAETEILVQIILYSFVSLTEGDMHLDCALAMPYIVYFLTSPVVDVPKKCRKIVIGHVLEGKLPKFLIFIRVVLDMPTRVLVASTVAQPHIIACIGKHKSWCLVLVVDDPSVRRVQQPMLEDNRF